MGISKIGLVLEKFFLNPPKPRHINKTLNYQLVSDKLVYRSGAFPNFETFLKDRQRNSSKAKEVHYQNENYSALMKAMERDDKYHFLLTDLSDRYQDFIVNSSLKKKELLGILDMEYELFQSKEAINDDAISTAQFSQHAFVMYYHYLSVYDSKKYSKLDVHSFKEIVNSRVYKQYIGSVRFEGVKKHMLSPFPVDRKNIAYTIKALNEAISIAHRERNERIADTLIRKLSKIHETYMDVRGIHEDDILS